jgi:hypothetical protein
VSAGETNRGSVRACDDDRPPLSCAAEGTSPWSLHFFAGCGCLVRSISVQLPGPQPLQVRRLQKRGQPPLCRSRAARSWTCTCTRTKGGAINQVATPAQTAVALAASLAALVVIAPAALRMMRGMRQDLAMNNAEER